LKFNVESAWGKNEVDDLESPQLMFNKTLATIIENAILMGNGIWIGDYDALSDKDWERLSNEPGSHVRVRTGKQLKRESAPPLPNYVTELLNILMGGQEKLSGITEVTEGRRPGQLTSGVAIEQLATMAQTTIRLKARQLDYLLQNIGQKLISRIFAYYTTDRVLTFSGTDETGKAKQYFYHREAIRQLIQKEGMQVFQDYVLKVVPTSSLALTKWQKGLMATQLYQLGLIDEKAALDALEFPGRDEILQRMAQGVQAAMMGGGGFGEKTSPKKLPANLLRGGNKQMPIQTPQQPGM